mmetsp:Transcript_88/g.152  ORF Transcript_88/g.152 Transcript_88/m.152 type:complete len:202 (-) Transcript_88:1512-2117(-)
MSSATRATSPRSDSPLLCFCTAAFSVSASDFEVAARALSHTSMGITLPSSSFMPLSVAAKRPPHALECCPWNTVAVSSRVSIRSSIRCCVSFSSWHVRSWPLRLNESWWPPLPMRRSIQNGCPLISPSTLTRAVTPLPIRSFTSSLASPFMLLPSGRGSAEPVRAHRGAMTSVLFPAPLLSHELSSKLVAVTRTTPRPFSG